LTNRTVSDGRIYFVSTGAH